MSPRIHANVDHIGSMDDKFVEDGDEEVDVSQPSGKDGDVTNRRRGFCPFDSQLTHFNSADNPTP